MQALNFSTTTNTIFYTMGGWSVREVSVAVLCGRAEGNESLCDGLGKWKVAIVLMGQGLVLCK